jgi:hypothetical protein
VPTSRWPRSSQARFTTLHRDLAPHSDLNDAPKYVERLQKRCFLAVHVEKARFVED